MKYLQRDTNGIPVGIFTNLQPGFAEEPVADDYEIPLSSADLVKQLEADIDAYVYEVAQRRGFNNVDSATKYKSLTDADIASLPAAEQPIVQQFRSDATALILWVNRVWAFCYSQENNIGTTTPVPTKDQLLAALPASPW